MRQKIVQQLYAFGSESPAHEIRFSGQTYKLHQVFKHDFFAVTALYSHSNSNGSYDKEWPKKIVLKLARRQHFLGLPLQWLGKALCEREVRILKKVRDIENVPNFVCRYGDYGFVYQYIEGKPLSKVKETPEDFFDKLEELLQNLHRRNICYVDMNKRDNIIVGEDGQPNLIDFQISVQIGKYSLGLPAFSKMIRNKLEKADRYHVLKHKRRLQPMSLKPSEWQASYSPSGLIKIHRVIATPIRRLRRKVLKSLHKKQPLIKQ